MPKIKIPDPQLLHGILQGIPHPINPKDIPGLLLSKVIFLLNEKKHLILRIHRPNLINNLQSLNHLLPRLICIGRVGVPVREFGAEDGGVVGGQPEG